MPVGGARAVFQPVCRCSRPAGRSSRQRRARPCDIRRPRTFDQRRRSVKRLIRTGGRALRARRDDPVVVGSPGPARQARARRLIFEKLEPIETGGSARRVRISARPILRLIDVFETVCRFVTLGIDASLQVSPYPADPGRRLAAQLDKRAWRRRTQYPVRWASFDSVDTYSSSSASRERDALVCASGFRAEARELFARRVVLQDMKPTGRVGDEHVTRRIERESLRPNCCLHRTAWPFQSRLGSNSRTPDAFVGHVHVASRVHRERRDLPVLDKPAKRNIFPPCTRGSNTSHAPDRPHTPPARTHGDDSCAR